MPKHHVFAMKFARVYPLYVAKAERKNRTREEVDRIICWLTATTKSDYGSRSSTKAILKRSSLKLQHFIRIVRLSRV